MKRRLTRGRIIGAATLVATAVVCVLLVLIAIGVLVLPTSPPRPVTVESVEWTIDQGQTAKGTGWFGASEINYTGLNGFPTHVTPGGNLVVTWLFSNFDSHSRTIVNVSVTNGFELRSTSPSLPVMVPAGEDDAYLMVTVIVPNAPGAGLTLGITVLAE